jgi:hypothetical protein
VQGGDPRRSGEVLPGEGLLCNPSLLKVYLFLRKSGGVIVMFIMPDFIHTPEEWIVWLLGSEFHGTATIDMLVQRTRYSREDILSFIGILERMKAVRVNRNARNAMIIDSIALVPNGKKMFGELALRSGDT